MKLNLPQIKNITTGAVRITEEADGFHFYRFTQEQEELYKGRNQDFYNKTFATSGVKLRFKTDSKVLFLKVDVTPGSSRTYFAFDVFADGKMIDSINNFEGADMSGEYIAVQLKMGEFSKEIALGGGQKEVCIYLPWSAKSVIKEITLDSGAFIEPVRPEKKLLCFGDSITHGYDALHPSNKYISLLAEYLDAEEINKAIGGEIFFPALAKAKEDFIPDYISVAYGTNDWNCCSEEEFIVNCKGFYKNLSENYPNSKIIAITPVWRKEHKDYRPFGEFGKVEEDIRNAVADLKNVVVVSGFNFVPPQEKFFADLRLHPNDEGFKYYAENLIKELSK